MATEKQIHELIGRAVADADFRASLVEDPETAVRDAGFDLTEEQLGALKQVDMRGLGADLDDRLSKEVGLGQIGTAPWPTKTALRSSPKQAWVEGCSPPPARALILSVARWSGLGPIPGKQARDSLPELEANGALIGARPAR